jgi:hypothetical protein
MPFFCHGGVRQKANTKLQSNFGLNIFLSALGKFDCDVGHQAIGYLIGPSIAFWLVGM